MNTRDAYLVDALVLLAETYPNGLTTAEIARRRGIPASFLGRLLATAARRGVVVTSRGPRGGVRLAHPPQDVRLASVVDVRPPSVRGGRAVQWLEHHLHSATVTALENVTVAELREREHRADGALAWNI